MSARVIDVAAALGRERGRDLERRERVAGVALGAVGEVRERVVVDREVLVAETAVSSASARAAGRAQVVDARAARAGTAWSARAAGR